MFHKKLYGSVCCLFYLLVVFLSFFNPSLLIAASANVTIDASKPTGIFKTVLTTQLAYMGAPAASVSNFAKLAPGSPIRIHMSSEDTDQPVLPEKYANKWDFGPLDSLVNEITSWGGQVMLNPKFPPDFMWSCDKWQAPGTIRDASYNQFGDYLARLVSYYNKGSVTTETGAVITNPAGIRNRVNYWEIWNEPDLSDETPCKPATGEQALSPEEYLKMWNAVVPKMLAVDSTIKLVGPTASVVHYWDHTILKYIPLLLSGAAHKPDILSFHGYGGWKNESTDLQFFDGGGDAQGIPSIIEDLKQVKVWAPHIPVWISELNVDAGWKEDPKKRPWSAYGTAWICSAYYHLGALGGADLIHQFVYWEGDQQDSMIESKKGETNLNYWRDYYVPRYFPKGSALLSTTSSLSGIEVMAAKPPGSKNIHVMVINRQVANKGDVGGVGVPATVEVNLSHSAAVKEVTVRMLDNSTPTKSGPPAIILPVGTSAKVSFSGYGVALLEFVLQPSKSK